MRKKKRPRGPGRPPTTERVQLTDLEVEYAKLRARGLNVEQACKALGIELKTKEMGNRERNFPLLRTEIERCREQEIAINSDQTLGLIHKSATDLRRVILDALTGSKELSVAEMDRAYQVLHQVDVKLQDLEERDRRFRESLNTSNKGEDDFISILEKMKIPPDVSKLKGTKKHCLQIFKSLEPEEQKELLNRFTYITHNIPMADAGTAVSVQTIQEAWQGFKSKIFDGIVTGNLGRLKEEQEKINSEYAYLVEDDNGDEKDN